MAKDRDHSHILTITPNSIHDDAIVEDVVLDALIDQRKRVKSLLDQLDADLESLGYITDEQ